MTQTQRDWLRRTIPLLTYLEQHGWKASRQSAREEVCGLCPLHPDHHPSFYVNRRKNVFFCHGCGQGGDLIRLVELMEGIGFAQALHRLRPEPSGEVWRDACDFYQRQLSNGSQAQSYLRSRGIVDWVVIERMGIGFAPGACLRGHLERLGHRRQSILDAGLIDAQGRDRLWRCVTFPIPETANLYGRHIDAGPVRHRFLARPKGGLYGWNQTRHQTEVILVEGLFDLASLWQAGFWNAAALLGSHGNAQQAAQLLDGNSRRVYLCLDADANGSGQRAAQQWARRLRQGGLRVWTVRLPDGVDPNQFFAEGGDAELFRRYLREAER